MSYAYSSSNGSGGGYSSGYGAFGGQGYNYSYATLTNSVDTENDRMKRRGSCGITSSRRNSDTCDKHATQTRHRTENANYGSLPSGLTMPRIPMVCNHKCQNDQRGERSLKTYPAHNSSDHHLLSSSPPRHGTKTASKTPRAPRPAGEKARPILNCDRARVSSDRAAAERKQYHRQSYESTRSNRSTRSKSQPLSQVSRPASIAPSKAQNELPALTKAKKKGSLWGCFGG